ncbi:MAG TPA: hypothetical protein VK456_11705 [Xanthobacteraceae bacterium]|nr:hypothetical protein [Xanthobacteraceae bacterium]
MKNVSLADCLQAGAVKLERVNYFDRQLLTVDDMVTERDYFLQKLRRHNRFLHGWGVVCGLAVIIAPTADQPWRVAIEPGYALGPYGDEIFVGEQFYLDLASCTTGATTDPCEPNTLTGGSGTAGGTVYVAIKYAECLARPVLAMSNGCGIGEQACEFSRICDSFEVGCLTELPVSLPIQQTLCEIWNRGMITPCPPCPDLPWVALASVKLPPASTTKLQQDAIDIRVRRIVFSTAVLQEQLIDCCCGDDRIGSVGVSSSSSSSSSSTAPNVQLVSLGVRQYEEGAQLPFANSANLTTWQPPKWEYQLTLSLPAPAGGFVVKLTSDHTDMTLPQPLSVTVPAGQTTWPAPPTTSAPAVPTTPGPNPGTKVTITATGVTGSGSATATLIFGNTG